jgi:thiol-disulfide isomerase/thioredoxin
MQSRLLRRAFAAGAIATLAVAVGACDSSAPRSAPVASTPAALEQQGGRLLGGGAGAFRRQLTALRGHPLVVNQWASWCGPCRYEFPFFQRLARAYAGRVAFLGVDAQDNRADAQAFLKLRPVPYPSFFDPGAEVARVFHGGFAWPTTAFYDAAGKLRFTHAGAYATQAKLQEDVRRYALG